MHTIRGIQWSLRVFASGVFILASTISCQIFSASSEHFRKIQMASSESSEHFWYFVNFPLAGISLLLIGDVVLLKVILGFHVTSSKLKTKELSVLLKF